MHTPTIRFHAGQSFKYLLIGQNLLDEGVTAIEMSHTLLLLEEKYQLLLGNFEELETEMLRLSLTSTLYSGGYEDIKREGTAIINRRVNNFLSSARLYVDQVPQDIRLASRSPDLVRAQFTGDLRRHYVAKLSYRVCEALRNYAQHRGLPVHGFGFGWRRDAEKLEGPVVHRASLQLYPGRLSEEGGFKSTVLSEMAELGETYDLKYAIREYVGCLGMAHMALRKYLSEDTEWSDRTIDHLYSIADTHGATEAERSVAIGVRSSDDIWEAKGYSRPADRRRREWLASRSPDAPRLERYHISSE